MRTHILGEPVDVVNMDTALEFIRGYVNAPENPPGFVLAVNPEKVMCLRKDRTLHDFFEKATLLIPDGIGVVKALRMAGHKNAGRVAGADLMQNICQHAPHENYRIFIYGAAEDVNEAACAELERRNPGIRIVGRSNGYIKPEQMDDLIDRINGSGANILFLALGSPGQERWMEKHADRLTTVRICQGIGGTLDTIIGKVKRAPLGWQKLGLEWLYRLLKQPKRIGRQMNLFYFILLVLKEKIFHKTK